MNDNLTGVTFLHGTTTMDIESSKVLSGGLRNCVKDVVLIGYDQDDELYFASAVGDVTKVLWLLEQAKKQLLEN